MWPFIELGHPELASCYLAVRRQSGIWVWSWDSSWRQKFKTTELNIWSEKKETAGDCKWTARNDRNMFLAANDNGKLAESALPVVLKDRTPASCKTSPTAALNLPFCNAHSVILTQCQNALPKGSSSSSSCWLADKLECWNCEAVNGWLWLHAMVVK